MDMLATYPRTGRIFFSSQVKPGFFDKTHAVLSEEELKKYNRIIGFVRYPLDTIASSVSMLIWANKETFDTFKENVDGHIRLYTEYFEWLLSINAVLIHNEDLKDVDKVISYLGYEKEIHEIPPEQLNKWGAVHSSKKLESYSRVYKYLSVADLSPAIEVYKKAFDRCVSFEN